jgi:Leucine-rich repeat (LRR) protein
MYHANGNMPTLTTLDLYDNALDIVITNMLGSLPNIEHLQLQLQLQKNIYLGRCHPLFHMCPGLCNYVGNNQMSGSFPMDMHKMQHLEELILSNNIFTGPLP